jgi:hypothetical protein
MHSGSFADHPIEADNKPVHISVEDNNLRLLNQLSLIKKQKKQIDNRYFFCLM